MFRQLLTRLPDIEVVGEPVPLARPWASRSSAASSTCRCGSPPPPRSAPPDLTEPPATPEPPRPPEPPESPKWVGNVWERPGWQRADPTRFGAGSARITAVTAGARRPVSLAELVATLSIVSDLGMGRPVERVLRQTVIAMRLADAAGVGRRGPRRHVLHVAAHLGRLRRRHQRPRRPLRRRGRRCTPTPTTVDLAGRWPWACSGRATSAGAGRRCAGSAWSAGSSRTGGRSVQRVMEAHCQSAGEFADRLGLGDDVRHPCCRRSSAGTAGRARPGRRRRAWPRRSAWCTSPTTSRRSTTPAAPTRRVAVVDRAAGHAVRPRARRLLLATTPTRSSPGSTRSRRGTRSSPSTRRLGQRPGRDQFDGALAAFADFADLKTPTRTGHSRGVAALAGDAASFLGLRLRRGAARAAGRAGPRRRRDRRVQHGVGRATAAGRSASASGPARTRT